MAVIVLSVFIYLLIGILLVFIIDENVERATTFELILGVIFMWPLAVVFGLCSMVDHYGQRLIKYLYK